MDASNDGQLEEFWLNTGITAVKVFTCYSSPDMGWVRDGILYKNMKLLADHNATMIIHSENHDLIALAEKELRDRGRCDGMAHCQSHPVLSEVEAIRRIIYYVAVSYTHLDVYKRQIIGCVQSPMDRIIHITITFIGVQG